jgi:hypothetical protein
MERGLTIMAFILDLQGLEAPAAEVAVPGSTISNQC